MNHDDLARSIRMGSLPHGLVGADPNLYSGPDRPVPSWDGWLRMWWGICWVRQQAFERDEETLFEGEMFG